MQAPVCAGGQQAGKWLCREEPGGPGGHQIEHGPARHLCTKESQQSLGLHWKCCHQMEGADPSPLLCTGEVQEGPGLTAESSADLQKPPGPRASSSGWPCLSRELDQISSRGPFPPRPFCGSPIPFLASFFLSAHKALSASHCLYFFQVLFLACCFHPQRCQDFQSGIVNPMPRASKILSNAHCRSPGVSLLLPKGTVLWS